MKAKRLIAVLCTLCILIGLLPAGVSAAESANGTFTDKNNVEFTWAYDASTKTLTIGGNGKMSWSGNDHVKNLPWYSFRGEILDVKFESGVTAIGRQLLSNLTSLKTITIPSNIKELEWGALEYCKSLESAVFESGVKYIGDKIFQNCTSLTSVSFPETVVKLGNAVFLNTPLTEVTVPASVTNLFPADTFQTQYTFDGVAEGFVAKIYRGSFAASWVSNPELNISSKLTYQLIGDEKEKVIGKMANRANTADAITWTYDPNTLSLLIEGTGGTKDFDDNITDCPWLDYKGVIRYVIVGEGITHIGARSFQTHTAMTNIVLPSTLQVFGSYAFNGVTNITKIVLPRGYKLLDQNAVFNRSGNLKEIVLPPTITKITAGALKYLPNDTKLVVKGGSYAHEWVMSDANSCQLTDDKFAAKPYVVEKDGGNVGDKITWEYDWENKTLIFTGEGDMPDANSRPWHVYKSVVEKAVINHGITNVGKLCFAEFTALKEVELPTTIKNLRDNCFKGCSSLTELNLSEGVNVLGLTILNGAAVKKLVVPQSVNTIYPNDVNKLHQNKTFGGTAEGFELIVTEGSYAHTWATGTTTDKNNGGTINNYEGILTVKNPGGKVNDTIDWEYDSKTNTMTFTGTGSMPNWTTVDVDGDGQIKDEPTWYENRPWHTYVALTSKLVFGEGITAVGADTFRGGSSLKELVFPTTLKRIEQYAFANTGLVEVEFNDSLEYIGPGAFQQSNPTELLLKVVIPSGVNNIESTAFKNQTAVTIYCYGDSYACEWAQTNGVKYILIDSEVFVTYDAPNKTVEIRSYMKDSVDAYVIVANYTGEELNDVYVEEATIVNGKIEITATDFEQKIGSVTRIMVWDSITDQTPLCKETDTKITQTIRIAGDSISAKWPLDRYGQQGWGEPFKTEWSDDVTVINDAVSGWTAEKYYNEKWAGIKAEMNPGDYLIVSYLHNDYYVPVKDTSKTDYINTYKGYLEKLIKETKEIGVNIVLVVPPNRGVDYNFHGDFSFVMPALAQEYNVPCIDVHAKTLEMLQSDLENTKQLLYMYKLVEQGIITEDQLANHSNTTFRDNGEDLTHLSTRGADWVAEYVATQLAGVVPELGGLRK